MSNFMQELSTDPSHQTIPLLLSAIGARLGADVLDKGAFFQAINDLHGILDELEVLTALHVISSGEDPLAVSQQTGFDDGLIRTCWFIAHPAPSQEM